MSNERNEDVLMRAEPATLTPALSQRTREREATCFLSLFIGRKTLKSKLRAGFAKSYASPGKV